MSFRLLFCTLCSYILFYATSLYAQEQQREVLPVVINSAHVEIRPFISGDGKTLYFGRREHPENQHGTKNLQDIWRANFTNNGWSAPENLGEPVNNRFVNSLCTVSPDEQELLVFNTYKKVEGPLARIRRERDQWGEPQEVVIENYYNHSEYLDFYQSYAHKVLLMALEREDTRGEQDLYVSFLKDDDSWSKPKNLGPVINTKKSDFAPFLAADGITLFFATYGLKGKGGADIYYTQRLDDSWTKWSKPVNLGASVNTSGEETYCSVTDDMRSIYYASYRHGSDKRDLYRTILPPSLDQLNVSQGKAPVLAVNKNIKSIQLDKAATTSQSLVERSSVQDGEAVEASVRSEAIPEGIGKPVEELSVAPAAPTANKAYSYTSSAPSSASVAGIPLKNREVPSDNAVMTEYSILRNVYFDFNQTEFKKDAYKGILEKLTDFMVANPNAHLKIVGHADELGSQKENEKASHQRAQRLKHYLVQQGIAAERLLVHFRGESEPLASNDDEREGRELNRRIEFFVLMPR